MPSPILDLPGEVWKPVVGYECFYAVSNKGRVKSLDRARNSKNGSVAILRGKLMRLAKEPRGRFAIQLVKDGKWVRFFVHRLVLCAFVGPCPEKFQCCHNNGNSLDNRIENLRWDTARANNADKRIHGTWQGGEKHPFAKLTAPAVVEIRERFFKGESCASIARAFSISWTHAHRIIIRRNWKHV